MSRKNVRHGIPEILCGDEDIGGLTMGKKYDGWAIRNREGSLILWSFQETKEEMIRKFESRYDDHWETLKEKYGFRIVKAKLVEVE